MIKKISIFLLFTAFLSVQGYGTEKEIYLLSFEYPPFYGENLTNQGVITELIRESFKKNGYKLKVKFYPFARSMMLGKKGRADGLYPLWKTSEREKWFIYSDPIPPPNIIGFYKRKNLKINFKNYQDLEPYRIGTVLGYAYPSDFLESGLRNIKIYKDETLIKNLVKGRIDLAVIERMQANYLLKLNFPDQIDNYEFMEPPMAVLEQYLSISRKKEGGQKIVNDFNQGLKIIQRDGTFKKIFKKHGF